MIHICFQPINYSPKSKRPTIEVYHRMTVEALAQAMNTDVGRVCFYYYHFSSNVYTHYLNIDHIYDCLILLDTSSTVFNLDNIFIGLVVLFQGKDGHLFRI